jgi:hypothetical protein
MSLNIRDLKNKRLPGRRQPTHDTPYVIPSQRGGHVLAYRKTFYRCKASESKKPEAVDLFNLYCGNGIANEGRCPHHSKGAAIIRDGKFVKFVKEPANCGCVRETKAMNLYGKHAHTHINAKNEAVEDLEKMGPHDAVHYQNKKMDSSVAGLRKRRALYHNVYYHAKKRQKTNHIPQPDNDDIDIEVSSDEELDSDMDLDERKEVKKRNVRRQNKRDMDTFCRKLKSNEGLRFRRTIRPSKGENHSTLMVALDQIGRNHDWILSQSNKQREVIVNSTKLSIDNNHKCATKFAERTLTLRALLHGKEWVSVGDALCLTKDENLHRELAKAMFGKMCTCSKGRCCLRKIKAICSDFETGLWRAFLTELHEHQ